MKTGDYAEYWGEGSIRVFDRNGVLLRTVAANRAPSAEGGRKQVDGEGLGTRECKADSDHVRQVIYVSCRMPDSQDRYLITCVLAV